MLVRIVSIVCQHPASRIPYVQSIYLLGDEHDHKKFVRFNSLILLRAVRSSKQHCNSLVTNILALTWVPQAFNTLRIVFGAYAL